MNDAPKTVVSRTVEVDTTPAEAFKLFTTSIDQWWPRTGFSIGTTPLRQTILEPGVGGRWFEVDEDGSDCTWGRVLVWEPGVRVVLSWQISAEWAYGHELQTEVDVLFTEIETGRTRVDLRHQLDGLGEPTKQLRDILDSPTGWQSLLDAYRSASSRVVFDTYTVVRLLLQPDAPQLSVEEAERLQDAHMGHTADMVAAGHILVAGPPVAGDEPEWRGLSIWATDPDTTRSMYDQDPAVRAGRLRPVISTWIVPRGQLHFGTARVPRSMAEVRQP